MPNDPPVTTSEVQAPATHDPIPNPTLKLNLIDHRNGRRDTIHTTPPLLPRDEEEEVNPALFVSLPCPPTQMIYANLLR